jgi:threonine synthase
MHITQKFIFECVTCKKQYPANHVSYLCPQCEATQKSGEPPAGVLRVFYDYEGLKKQFTGFKQLSDRQFIDLLPLQSLNSLPPLKIGNTPLYTYKRWGETKLPFRLLLKDDSQNPTFSFKDRASAVVSAFAREQGFDTLVAASTGNAGSSLAGICASQGQKAIIMVPKSAPVAKLTQIIMYGATIVPVNGNYDQAFDLSVAATKSFGWYNRNTAFNPLTIEGKKTVAFEIFDQTQGILPERIFVSVGDGVIISGLYKGFEDLLKLNLIEKMPKIIAVQAQGSDNLARNIQNIVFQANPSTTLADSISVDIPRNFFMAKDFITNYQGETVTVSDLQIVEAASALARNTGLFAEPAAAAAMAGLLQYMQQNRLEADTGNLVLLTGSGLKDLKAFTAIAKIPEPVNPDLDSLKAFLK